MLIKHFKKIDASSSCTHSKAIVLGFFRGNLVISSSCGNFFADSVELTKLISLMNKYSQKFTQNLFVVELTSIQNSLFFKNPLNCIFVVAVSILRFFHFTNKIHFAFFFRKMYYN
jgi:hypothetical protein